MTAPIRKSVAEAAALILLILPAPSAAGQAAASPDGARPAPAGFPAALDYERFSFPPFREVPRLSEARRRKRVVVQSVTLTYRKKSGAEIPGWRVELYSPRTADPGSRLPLVVVMPFGGLGMDLSASFARRFAARGFLALELERPPPEAEGAVLHSLTGTVKTLAEDTINLRRVIDWASRLPQADPARIGILGVSRGAIVAALAVQQDSKLRAVFVLGGADLAGLYRRSHLHLVKKMRAKETARAGGDPEKPASAAAAILGCVDPASRPGRIDPARTVLINAKWDRVVPRASALALREAAGGATQVWLPCGHYGTLLFARRIRRIALRHFEQTLR